MPRLANLAAIIALTVALLAAITYAAMRSSRAPAPERSTADIVADLASADPWIARDAEHELERRWPASRAEIERAARSDDPRLARHAQRLLDRLLPSTPPSIE
jgi:hypothetical protein